MELHHVFQHSALMESLLAAFEAFKLKCTWGSIRFMQSTHAAVTFFLFLLKLILIYYNIFIK